MKSLIKTSVKRSVTVCVLVVVLLALGVLATMDMSAKLLPNIRLPMMGVSIVYPGASAQSVEDGVTSKVTTALQTVPGIKELETTSYDNVSVAILTFDYGTDIDEKISAIEDAFESVTFPEGCEQPDYIKIDMNGTATATISLYNAQGNIDELSADAKALQSKLTGIEGVGSVSVLGTPERQICVTPLEGLDISALLVVQALSNENLNIPLGTVMQDGTVVSLRNASDAASVLDVMRLPVELPLGSEIIAQLDKAKTALGSLAMVENATLQGTKDLFGMLIMLKNATSGIFGDPTKSDEQVRTELLDWINMMDQTGLFKVMGITLPENLDELLSVSVVRLMRSENFYVPKEGETTVSVENADPNCIVGVLLDVKAAHVDADGNPIYQNGKAVVTDEAGNRIVTTAAETSLYVNEQGYLQNADGNPVDEEGNVVELTDGQLAERYNFDGGYTVFQNDELVRIAKALGLAEGVGVELSADMIHLVKRCDFSPVESDGTAVYPQSVVVPIAYIGHVSETVNDIAFAQYNGMLAVTIEVYAVADADTTEVVDSVKDVLANTPTKGSVVLLDDKAQFIEDSINNVLSSIIIGGVLAVLVIYLFVRKVGSSLVVSITMPLSVLVALAGLWAMGISLNLVSLGGLAVGIGMLVDNSIVVLESITKRRDLGENVHDACVNGTGEVAGSLFASTLTNVCVFFPILFARGLTREIFYDLVWAVLFSIVMSLIVAVTVIPSLYHLIYKNSPRRRFKKNKDGTRTELPSFEDMEPRRDVLGQVSGAQPHSQENVLQQEAADKEQTTLDKKQQRRLARQQRRQRAKERLQKVSISRMESGYGKILSKVLTKRVLVCVVALVLFGSSIALVFTTGTEFLPSVDKGVIEVDVDFDTSTDLAAARATGEEIAQAISLHYGDKLQYVSVTVGMQGLLATSNSGVIRIQTDTDQLKTSQTVQEIRDLLKGGNYQAKNITVREMDGVVAEVTGGMSGQSVELLCDDMDVLRQAAALVTEKLLAADPEHIVSALDNTPALGDEYSFTFDRTKCVELGVDYQNAVLLLRVGLSGYTAANINVDGENIAVTVQFDQAEQRDIQTLCQTVVGVGKDGVVHLEDVLKPAADGKLYTQNKVASAINRHDGKFSTKIDLEIYGMDSGSAGKIISKAVHEVIDSQQFASVSYLEGGVTSYLNDAFDGLIVSLVAAFVLLYSVMACQFESLSKPFIVIMSIPFSFTGGFLALAITGMTLNVVSFVGLIMLMGVIVNGAIVMIDKINMLIADGMAPRQAVVEGCKSRLRPILMTTLTTVLALVPLALGLGRGGELMQPMGIVVLGGLLLGTMVTLVLIPCFYCLIKRIRFDKKGVDKEAAKLRSEPSEQANCNDGVENSETNTPETPQNE